MVLKGQAQLLRIFIGEQDMYGHKPLYEVIVETAKETGLAGASVFKGMLSYGASSARHNSKMLDFSRDHPMVIEIIDMQDKMYRFLQQLDTILESSGSGGLVTMEKVQILKYSPKKHHE